MVYLRAIIAALFLVAFASEAGVAATPSLDHHEIVSLDRDDEPQSDHGQHALHACGACHHAVDLRLGAIAPPAERHLGAHPAYSDRAPPSATEPPFQPPI